MSDFVCTESNDPSIEILTEKARVELPLRINFSTPVARLELLKKLMKHMASIGRVIDLHSNLHHHITVAP